MKNKDRQAIPSYVTGGLTRREYAAIHVLAGLAVDPHPTNHKWTVDTVITIVDKLFEELDKKL